jgi:hypothetical protein
VLVRLKPIDFVINPEKEAVRVLKELALTVDVDVIVLDPRPLAELVAHAVPVLDELIDPVPVLLNAIV